MLLLEECQAVVRSSPREAADLARLVPLALDHLQGRRPRPWFRELHARAEAHYGNALRVLGDLVTASWIFDRLRQRIAATSPLTDPDAEAEIANLEASLRIDQRRFEDADRLLAAAAALGSHRVARYVLVKHGNLQMTLGRHERALRHFEEAAATLSAATDPLLHLATVTGRVDCLCELGHADEADLLLEAERNAYVGAGDRHLQALHTFYRARVDLGLGRHADAERGFTAATQQLLALNRNYDAIIAALYLAVSMRASGKTEELRKLAADLVPLFESRGVEREKLASLRLHAEAA
jgi:tetratricopeptide (TPR) repeat protein